ncbi:hypothetical protein RhiirC2_712803 [Rhizophagus irregularis]|uniref:Uncharacterized protein n=1 Tax=Rhizophagus irregularis TaxID=588596 RepID=A0A2N1N5Q0_9GLOM|nr:hypothetical protein RhiirC2_712803 [Rhizophagus irregularis]
MATTVTINTYSIPLKYLLKRILNYGKEMIILSQACKFSSVKNAKTFATLIDSSVGTKEVVHIIFKGMPLIDGGVDPRISKSCEGFTNLSDDFARIAGDWFIIEEQPYYDDIETNNEHGNFTINCLRIGDVVMMQIQDYNECYVIVEAIFSHKANQNLDITNHVGKYWGKYNSPSIPDRLRDS